jgi:hypothetical protein
MKRLLLLVLTAAPLAAVQVGDSYDSVVAEKGKPKSQMQAGAMRLLTYDDLVVKLSNDSVVSVRTVQTPSPTSRAPASAAPAPTEAQPQARATSGVPYNTQDAILALRKQMKDAVNKVVLIVNQPVQGVPKTPDMRLAWFGDGWFHPGAGVPDFDRVDIRQTQETSQYARFDYCASSLAPDVAYPADQLEYNGATKFFYQDRSVPKKKLSEVEMLEVNRLYRIIGRCNRSLAQMGAQ